MTRYLWATISLLAISSVASANLARVKPQEVSTELRLAITGIPTPTEEVQPPTRAELNSDTEVYLNGKRSSYKSIPKTASVSRVILAPDGKTIVRIEFTTEK
ncbi:MAG: hypothetical protein K8U57_12925 [Planctomycetes bacterium]|nr:hypothetical protein [Planctomycetota bacterium]